MARSKRNKSKVYLKRINLKPGKFRKDFLSSEERRGKREIANPKSSDYKKGGLVKGFPKLAKKGF